MNMIKYILFLVFIAQACASNEAIFELKPQQSMSITGKGVGQDAAYNPYGNEKSISVVKNLGNSTFNVRIQKSGQILEDVEIPVKGEREFILDLGVELYLDSDANGRAQVSFRKFK